MVAVWLLAVLCFSFSDANSNGVGILCDVNNANLGTTNRVKDTTRVMWWSLVPAWSATYSVRTGDGATPDPVTSYVPNQWMNIYVRTLAQDKQFTGMIMYATNAAGTKVGSWQTPMESPYKYIEGDCVTHTNADPKPYMSVFKFKGPPAGTGAVKINVLLKYGLAFPANEGAFYWPGAGQHLSLTEGASAGAQSWFEGEVGQSCYDVCNAQGLGCDINAIAAANSPAALLAAAGPWTNCTPPILVGCGAGSPSVGLDGCFYHSDDCIQPAAQVAWTRRDPCATLTACTAGTVYNPTPSAPACCSFQGQAWCAAYYTQNVPNPANAGQQGNAWYPGSRGDCKPAGGWPAGVGSVVVPARTTAPSSTTCGAVKSSTADGRRLCACSPAGERSADSAWTASVSIGGLTVLIMSFLQ